MKKVQVGVFLFLTFTLLACSQNQASKNQNNSSTNDISKKVGNDSDVHGCKASVGERWSFLQHKCVRLFEDATRLLAEGNEGNSAFILFNDDSSKAELFLPKMKEEKIILIKKGNEVYKSEGYQYNNLKGILYVNGVKKYIRKMVQLH